MPPGARRISAASSYPRPKARRKGQLRWLVERYYESAAYQLLDATKRVQCLILDDIRMARGTKPYAYMELRYVEAIKVEYLRTGSE